MSRRSQKSPPADHREEGKYDGKYQYEQDAQIKGGHGKSQQGKDAVEIVDKSIPMDGGRDAQRDAQDVPQHNGEKSQLRRKGQHPADLPGHRVAGNGGFS